MTTLAERRDDLAGLIGNLNSTTRALGNQKTALAEAVGEFPGFMRQANTSFVNLRAALDDVDPLVDASKPRGGPARAVPRPDAQVRRRRRADGARPERGDQPQGVAATT